MKNSLYLLLSIVFYVSSCEPNEIKPIFNTESVKLIGSISDTNEVIHLGDSLKFSIQVPDTISTTSGKLAVQSLGYSIFIMRILKVDTTNYTAILPNASSIIIKNGSFASSLGNYVLNYSQKPYGFDLSFKSQEKGIYYFNVVTQPGDIRINNNYQARLFIGFNTVNNHLHLVSPYFGGQTWENDIIMQNINQGFGFYVFRVN
jgi:hypothetical protein